MDGSPPSRLAERSPWGAALVVSADEEVRGFLLSTLGMRFSTLAAATLREVIDVLVDKAPCMLMVVAIDACEHALDVARAAQLAVPAPAVIAVHRRAVHAAEAFAFGRAGARQLVPLPCTAACLLHAVAAGLDEQPPPISAAVAPFVGKVPLLELERGIRSAVIAHALKRAGDNKSRAARLVGVPRAIVQRVAKRAWT